MPRWVAVLLLYAGCAFSIAGPDPDRPSTQAPRCDTGKGLVVLDGLVAATSGVFAIAMVGGDEPALALLPVAIGALYAGGAVSGNNKANACRKEMDEYSSMIAARETLDRQRPRFEQVEAE